MENCVYGRFVFSSRDHCEFGTVKTYPFSIRITNVEIIWSLQILEMWKTILVFQETSISFFPQKEDLN